MNKKKIIKEKLNKAFEKLSKRFSVPVKDLRIAIICTGSENLKYAAYKGINGIIEKLDDIELKDVVDLGGIFSLAVSEDDVREGILNKMYLFSIPIQVEMSELRVFILPTAEGSQIGFLYKKNELLNQKGFDVCSLF